MGTRGLGFKERVRRDILKKRALVRGGYGKVVPAPAPVRRRGLTLAMHLIEQKYGRSMEELIGTGEIKDVGLTLGVDPSTISKWRRRLGLR